MKRQLNFWTKMRGLPDKDLINTSLSIEGNKFTVRFGRPGSVEPIDQLVIDLTHEESIALKYAFELAGANVFQDEMDERIYFANIAMARDDAKRAENFGICVGWITITFILCMIILALLTKIPVVFVTVISLFISISLGLFIKKKFYKDP